MKKYIILLFIFFTALFFIGPQPNYKYDVNYIKVNRHLNSIIELSEADAISNYIANELDKYDYNVSITEDLSVVVKNNIKSKSSDNITFIAHYNKTLNSPGASNNSLAISSLIAALQTKDLNNTFNDFTIIFYNSKDDSLNGNTKFINDNTDLFSESDYIISLDSRGSSGDLYIYNTSLINSDIINFYKNSVTSTSGISDFTRINTKEVKSESQILSLAMLNDTIYNNTELDTIENINPESMQNYINTVFELLYSVDDYKFENTNSQATFFNYLDAFIVIDNFTMMILTVLTIFLVITLSFINRDNISIKNILMASLSILIIPVFCIALSILPFRELISLITLDDSRIVLLINYFIEAFVLVFVLSTTIIVSNLTTKLMLDKFKINIIEISITIILYMLIISLSQYLVLKSFNSTTVIIGIAITLLLAAIKLNYSTYRLCLLAYLLIVVPLIVSSSSYLFNAATLDRLIIFMLPLSVYILAIIPILKYVNHSIINTAEYNNL